MKNGIVAAMVTGALLGTASMAAYAHTTKAPMSHAKLSMAQARAKALKLVPGTIKSAELEKETGGSGLRYSFDIRGHQGLREVGIDAVTGKLLENSHESAKAEKQERRSER